MKEQVCVLEFRSLCLWLIDPKCSFFEQSFGQTFFRGMADARNLIPFKPCPAINTVRATITPGTHEEPKQVLQVVPWAVSLLLVKFGSSFYRGILLCGFLQSQCQKTTPVN